jgi:glycosyltransferase involved in cell wall biosynthesis
LRILVLSFYYPPDLSAGSFRAKAFVDALETAANPDDIIEVVTTLPNRYRSFSLEAPEKEIHGRVITHRIRLPRHRGGMADQIWAFAWFALKALRHVKQQPYQLIYATTSRLFTGFLGALLAKRSGAALYLDIRDIFIDTIADILRPTTARALMPLLQWVEGYTVRAGDRINLVSEGFREYFQVRYPEKRYSYYTNGIDDDFLGIDFRPSPSTERKGIILYAGNIGEGQGLHRILPGMAKRLGGGWEFWIVGDGGKRRMLLDAATDVQVSSIKLIPPVSRTRLIELYRESDVLFLHLNALDAFHKVLPSKIFEYAATGKPILAGVAGYAASFLAEHVDNAAVFPPCDPDAGVRALATLKYEHRDRESFIGNFRRSHIMHRLAVDVLQLAREHARLRRETTLSG